MRHAAIGLALVWTAPALAQPADGIEVRFCPENVAHPYPLDSLRGVQGLVLQNIAILNRGAAPAEITSVEIALLRGGEVQDSRRIAGPGLEAAARTGHGLQARGMVQALGFQFCGDRLLGTAQLPERPTLAGGDALLLMQQVFAWRGTRDEARITVAANMAGRPTTVTASLRLDSATSRTTLRWPLAGGPWLVGAGASFHSTHRWAVPEEFALDIFKVDGDGLSRRGDGSRNEQFFAYGADVLAAADGRVARLITGSTESPPMLRAAGEALDAYYARISARQAEYFAAGAAGILGDAVVIDHGNGEYSVYAHLIPGSASVRQGEEVRAGQTIARLGSSGNSTEPHLHFQLCDRADGLLCAGIIPNFTGIELPVADGPRPLQSGDLVVADPPTR